MFPLLEIWNDDAIRSPATHMALDEALLFVAKTPTLRFYRWSAPAVTFGYAQRYANVCDRAGDLTTIRRWTGGGIVFHGSDLTLALAIPIGFALCEEAPQAIYHTIHQRVIAALAAHFPNARLAIPGDCLEGLACFENPALHDILNGDTKICGGALRRSRQGVLYQGSLQLASDGLDIAQEFSKAIKAFQNITSVEKSAKILEREKYNTKNWNRKR